jgi:hypothetical protein
MTSKLLEISALLEIGKIDVDEKTLTKSKLLEISG